MKFVENIEKLRVEIQHLKKVISKQNEYLKEYKSRNLTGIEKLEDSISENKEKLRILSSDFQYLIKKTENKNDIEAWIDIHKQVVFELKNFSLNFLNEKRVYSKERIQNIQKVEKAWDFFLNTQILPDTFFLDDYEMFARIKILQRKFSDIINIDTFEEIAEMENMRQNLFILNKRQSANDMILDKGSSWGFRNKDVSDAEKDYTITKKNISVLTEKLQKFIENLKKSNRKLFESWIFLHLYTCINIIDYSYTVDCLNFKKDSTRIFVADETFYLWQNVLLEEKEDFIIPNTYYLSDYNQFFNEIFETLKQN